MKAICYFYRRKKLLQLHCFGPFQSRICICLFPFPIYLLKAEKNVCTSLLFYLVIIQKRWVTWGTIDGWLMIVCCVFIRFNVYVNAKQLAKVRWCAPKCAISKILPTAFGTALDSFSRRWWSKNQNFILLNLNFFFLANWKWINDFWHLDILDFTEHQPIDI